MALRQLSSHHDLLTGSKVLASCQGEDWQSSRVIGAQTHSIPSSLDLLQATGSDRPVLINLHIESCFMSGRSHSKIIMTDHEVHFSTQAQQPIEHQSDVDILFRIYGDKIALNLTCMCN
jgi:hypothetical protein